MSDNASALVFVDTNVLVYAYDLSAGEKHERARRLVEELWRTRRGCISIQILQEFFVDVTRNFPLLPYAIQRWVIERAPSPATTPARAG